MRKALRLPLRVWRMRKSSSMGETKERCESYARSYRPARKRFRLQSYDAGAARRRKSIHRIPTNVASEISAPGRRYVEWKVISTWLVPAGTGTARIQALAGTHGAAEWFTRASHPGYHGSARTSSAGDGLSTAMEIRSGSKRVMVARPSETA